MALAILIIAQILFTAGDFIARANLQKSGFTASIFLTWWFMVYVTLRSIATVGQLYVLLTLPIGKAYSIFGAVGIMLAGLVGFLWLKETLTFWEYVGISLSIIAFIALSLKN